MTGHAGFMALGWRSGGGEADLDSASVSWRSKLMPTAAGMVMRNALIRRGRDLVLIAFIMASCLGGHRDTIEPLGRVRSRARP